MKTEIRQLTDALEALADHLHEEVRWSGRYSDQELGYPERDEVSLIRRAAAVIKLLRIELVAVTARLETSEESRLAERYYECEQGGI